MPSLYARYLDERTDDRLIETDKGFVTYRRLNNKQIYAIDIYVLPEYRQQGVAAKLLDQVCEYAKSIGCEELLGTVLSNKSWTSLNIKMMFNYGFEITSSTTEAIILKKDI